MEAKREDNINIDYIEQAGKALKTIVFIVLIIILLPLIGFFVAYSSSYNVDTIKQTLWIVGFISIILVCIVLIKFYQAGDNLENVVVRLKTNQALTNALIKSNNIQLAPKFQINDVVLHIKTNKVYTIIDLELTDNFYLYYFNEFNCYPENELKFLELETEKSLLLKILPYINLGNGFFKDNNGNPIYF